MAPAMEHPWYRDSTVNPGRRATRPGVDEIHPWIDVRRRFVPSIARAMVDAGIHCKVSEAATIDDDRHGVFVVFDRISFPRADLGEVQRVLDDWHSGSR